MTVTAWEMQLPLFFFFFFFFGNRKVSCLNNPYAQCSDSSTLSVNSVPMVSCETQLMCKWERVEQKFFLDLCSKLWLQSWHQADKQPEPVFPSYILWSIEQREQWLILSVTLQTTHESIFSSCHKKMRCRERASFFASHTGTHTHSRLSEISS